MNNCRCPLPGLFACKKPQLWKEWLQSHPCSLVKSADKWKSGVYIFILFVVASAVDDFSRSLRSPSPESHRVFERAQERPVTPALSPVPQQLPQEIERRADTLAPGVRQKTPEEIAAEHQKYLARYLNTNQAQNYGKQRIALVVVSEKGSLEHTVSGAIAGRIRGESVEIFPSLFKIEFVSDGLFNSAFSNPAEVVSKLDLAKFADVVLLGREKVRYSTNRDLENVMTANMELECAMFPTRDNTDSRAWTLAANGAGFRQNDARQMAEDRLIKQIATDAKLSLSW